MEDNIQTIIVVIISMFILFIFPIYMAYEKKDDISYALAMRYTQDLVDEVRSKGYISKYMYEDYRAKLKVTGNTYNVELTHEYNRYDPITNYYKIEDSKYTLVKTATREQKETYEQEALKQAVQLGKLDEDYTEDEMEQYMAALYKEQDIDRVEDTYRISKQIYTTDHILNVLNSERKLLLNANSEIVTCSDDAYAEDGCQYAYTMNVDDNFNVTIKNTNITLATVIYNMVTANTLDNNTRIYVNYGGDILSSKWYGDIDYTKMKHDNLTLDKLEATDIFEDERKYVAANGSLNPIENIAKNYDGDYAISFDVKPNQVTELKEKGILSIADYSGYNFAVGNNKELNENSMLSVSVGINGVSLVTSTSINLKATTDEALALPTYNKPVERTRTVQEEYTYTDETTGEIKVGLRDKLETYIEYVSEQRRITDYSKITFDYESRGKIRVVLYGKDGVGNIDEIINVSDDNNLLAGLEKTIENPVVGVTTGYLGQTANRGTKAKYAITISNSAIEVSANKFISNEMTILSYPETIDSYVNVKVEVNKNELNKYVASLYLDGVKVEESVQMDVMPKVNVIGMTYIGNELRYFDGNIKNAKLYN